MLARASRRSARAARRARPSAARRRRRRGSAGGGSGRRRRREAAAGRTDELLAHERRAAASARSARRARAPRRRRGGRPAPRPPRARARRARDGSSWSSRAASSAWIVAGTVDLAAGDSSTHRDHLLDEERVALGGLPDPLAQRPVDATPAEQLVDQLVRLLGRRAARAARRSRSACRRPSPAAARAAPAAPCRGAGSARRATSRRRARRGRGTSARPSGGRRTRRRAAAPPRRPRAACGTPTRSPRRTSSPCPRRAAPRIASPASAPSSCSEKLLHDLDDRPVGDPLAVRTGSAHGRPWRVEPAEELGGQARLADAGGAEDREERARAVANACVPARPRAAAARARGRPSARPAAARQPVAFLADGEQPVRRRPARPCPSRERLDGLDLDRIADERVGLGAEQHLARLRRPARAARRRSPRRR